MIKIKRRIEYILKHNLIIQTLYRFIMSNFFRIIGLFLKVENNLVLFVSFAGKSYSDSPRVIYEYIKSNPQYDYLNCVWAFEEPDKISSLNCKKVKIDTLHYFILALKAKYWVTSVNIERGLSFKKKETVYLNTWHGVPLKKVGNAYKGRKDFDFSNVNFLCYSSKYEKEIYLKDFNAKEESLILTGLPRNDQLFKVNDTLSLKLRKDLNIPENKKVILYAPTWRESHNKGSSYSLKPPINIERWKETLGDDYILLLRTHIITNELQGIQFDDFVRDASSYSDISKLLIISDVLISDYSSVIFDFSILEKPIICFGYDYDNYNKERGFYFDLKKELPNGVLKSEEEVLDKLLNMDYQFENIKTRNFKNKYLEVDGNATEKCVKSLFRAMGGEQ